MKLEVNFRAFLCAAGLLVPALLIAEGEPAPGQDVFLPPATPPEYRASRTSESIAIDGVLDEPIWRRAEAITGLVQKDPAQGEPLSYATEVRVAFDDEALYIGAICHQPRSTLRIQNLQRDFLYEQNDLFGIAIDGFLDRRNAVVFQTTPYGSQRDMEVIDSSEVNTDWDARWQVRTTIDDEYWTVEMAIPWRNLRYPAGADRFGVIFTRNIRSRDERGTAPAVPRVFSAYRMAYAGILRGIQAPPPGVNLQLNPYALSDGIRDSTDHGTAFDNRVGGELKWAISPNTVLDVTVNTDFAQADVDRQVVNLDRFSVFFPERRQFFLEGANIFNASVTDWIRPFFSRRIGLDDAGLPIPLDGGLRLTGRTPTQEYGLLAMQQQSLDASPTSLFGVARYSRNVAGQSRIGGMFTYRGDDAVSFQGLTQQATDNFTYTIDGLWRPTQSVGVQAMVSASKDDVTGNGVGAQLWAFYENNAVYIGLLEYFNRDYNPGAGLEILDRNYMMHSPAVNLDLRPGWLPGPVRSFDPGLSAYIFQDSDDGDLLFGYAPIRPFSVRFHNGAYVSAYVEPNWQRLDEPFSPLGIDLDPGNYDYTRFRLEAESDLSARLSASTTVEIGDYFDGSLSSYTLSGRIAPWPQLELSADMEFNQVRSLGPLAEDKNARLYGITARLAPNPRFQLSAFYQWNSDSAHNVWNVRMAWEFRPLSYLYLVYNRNDFESTDVRDRFEQEQFIAKFTWLFEL